MFRNMVQNMTEAEMWKRLEILRPITKGWPNVPEDGRIDSAIQDLRTHGLHPNPSEFPDAEIISEFLETGRFQRWANSEMNRQKPSTLGADDLIQSMMTIGAAGSSDTTIALAVDTSQNPGQRPNIFFDRIPRDPEWMGFCPELRRVKTCDCIIMESSIRTGQPAIILATNTARRLAQSSRSMTSAGHNQQALQKLLIHHGAAQAPWFPTATRK